jgi:hypothetical protein
VGRNGKTTEVGVGIPEMRIADCRMRIGKEYNSESHNPKSKIGWPMLALHQHGAGLAAQSDFPSEPLTGFHKIFDQLIWR